MNLLHPKVGNCSCYFIIEMNGRVKDTQVIKHSVDDAVGRNPIQAMANKSKSYQGMLDRPSLVQDLFTECNKAMFAEKCIRVT